MSISKDLDLSYAGNDPGAAKFGNFINYYSFHSPEERVQNFDAKMFPMNKNKEIICLDVGCNTGELTKQLYTYLSTIYSNANIKMLAIDIDPTLIKRAQEHNIDCNILFTPCDITTDEGCKLIKEFIKNHNKDMLDIIFCFSVTMWIHINNGDQGLTQVLKFIKENSRTVIIEPQPWKCYKNAQRRMRRSGKSFELYNSLNIRDNIDTVIENVISESHVKVYESPYSSWNRKIQSFLMK